MIDLLGGQFSGILGIPQFLDEISSYHSFYRSASVKPRGEPTSRQKPLRIVRRIGAVGLHLQTAPGGSTLGHWKRPRQNLRPLVMTQLEIGLGPGG